MGKYDSPCIYEYIYNLLAWEPNTDKVYPALYPQLNDFTGILNFRYKSRPTQLRISKPFPWVSRVPQ